MAKTTRRNQGKSLLLALGALSAFAHEPVYFRSDRGIASGSEPLPAQLESAELVHWRTPTDPGHSTPVLAAGRLFLTTFREADRRLATIALDATTGRLLWEKAAPAEHLEMYHRVTGSPAAAAPACDGERVYSFFGSYGLICHDLTGEKIWERRLGPFQDEYGASSSPVLFGEQVYLSEDHDLDSFLLALDRRTGAQVWKVSRPDAVRSYSTPAVWSRDGRPELLVAGALQLTAYDPGTGEKLWWANGLARIVIPVPAPFGDTIYMASWTPGGDAGQRLALDAWPNAVAKWDRNGDRQLARDEIADREVLDRFFRMDLNRNGALDEGEWERHAAVFKRAQNALLAIRPPAGRGDLTASAVVWKYQRGVPYVASPLVHQGLVWMVKDGGLVTKLDAATGRVLEEERLPALGGYYASPVAGDGKVYFASESGVVSVVRETREWELLSSRDFHEKIYATPILEKGCLYLRTEQAVYCLGTRPGRTNSQ